MTTPIGPSAGQSLGQPVSAAAPRRGPLHPALDALLIVAVALLVRGLYLSQFRHSPIFEYVAGDGSSYDLWARRIASGDWLGKEVFYQAPLYPYLLACIYKTLGAGLWGVRIVQALLGAAACGLLTFAGGRLFSRPVGLLAGALLALYPTAFFLDALIQKSVLDTFLLCLLLALLSRVVVRESSDSPAPTSPRPRLLSWLAIGLTTGLLVLTRENAMVFPLLFLLFIALGPLGLPRRQRLAPALMLIVGLVLTLGPVALRNRALGGAWQVSTSQAGPNFYIGNGPQADGSYIALRTGRGAVAYERDDAVALAEGELGRTLTPAEVSRFWFNKTFRAITADPARWARLVLRKSLLAWNRLELVDNDDQEAYAQWSPLLRWVGLLLHFGTLVPVAALGVVLTWRRRRELWLLHAMVLLYALTLVAFYIVARYRFPLVPMLALFAAAGVVELCRARRAGLPRPAFVVGGVALVGSAVLCNIAVGSSSLERGSGQYNVGYILMDMGHRPAEALPYFRRAVELAPSFAEARLALGDALDELGDESGAVQQYLEAIKADETFAEPHFRVARIAASRGRVDVAIEHYQAMIKANLEPAQAHDELGRALASMGRFDDALAHLKQAVALDGHDVKARLDLCELLLQLGRGAEALEHARAAVALRPRSAKAHCTLGDVLSATGQMPDAVGAYQQALNLDAQAAPPHAGLGAALVSAGQSAEAIPHLQHALARGYDTPALRFALGRALLEQRQPEAAIAHLQALLTQQPQSHQAHHLLGLSFADAGKVELAIEQFREALRLKPDFAPAKHALDQAAALPPRP